MTLHLLEHKYLHTTEVVMLSVLIGVELTQQFNNGSSGICKGGILSIIICNLKDNNGNYTYVVRYSYTVMLNTFHVNTFCMYPIEEYR